MNKNSYRIQHLYITDACRIKKTLKKKKKVILIKGEDNK